MKTVNVISDVIEKGWLYRLEEGGGEGGGEAEEARKLD